MSKSFALYRFPYENQCTLMFSTHEEPEILFSYSELSGKRGFVFAPFEISDKYPLLLIKPDVVETFGVDDNHCCFTSLFETRDKTTERTLYGSDFKNFHSRLEDETFLKIVLSRCSEETGEAIDPQLLFRRACSLYPRMFIALVSAPQCGMWLMATPEILLESKDDRWHTMALAGTIRLADETRLQSLSDNDILTEMSEKWDRKNKSEQQYVARYIGETLRRFTDNVDETEPHTVRAGNLFHLVSDFYFTLGLREQLGALISELHPTPAVCGIPKHEAYKFISANESHERGYYSGFAGPLDYDKSTHLYVTLRCMEIEGGKYRLYAGGGLLKDSEEETEWLETEAKMDTMRKCLAIKRI